MGALPSARPGSAAAHGPGGSAALAGPLATAGPCTPPPNAVLAPRAPPHLAPPGSALASSFLNDDRCRARCAGVLHLPQPGRRGRPAALRVRVPRWRDHRPGALRVRAVQAAQANGRSWYECLTCNQLFTGALPLRLSRERCRLTECGPAGGGRGAAGGGPGPRGCARCERRAGRGAAARY